MTPKVSGIWLSLVVCCALVLSTQAQGEGRDLFPRLERQQREADQALRLEQESATHRDQTGPGSAHQLQDALPKRQPGELSIWQPSGKAAKQPVQSDRNAREQFQQGVLHEQQRREASVWRPAANRSSISRPTRANTNIRLQQFGRQRSSKALQFKITR